MRIETASDPGDPRRPNEDYAAAALPAVGWGGVLVVLDGVTPPEGDDGCVHGVPWFTARLGGALLELSGSHRGLTLGGCLGEAIARTAGAHCSTCDLSHARTPQATAVVVRWDEETVEHLVLSDSTLLLEAPDGSVTAVRDTRLDALPRDPTIENFRNAEGGFFTAAADPSVAVRAVTGTTPRSRVRAVAALTDGAARWVDTFRLGGWADALAALRTAGPAALIARVRAAESADPDRTAHPRGKARDDATAVFIELCGPARRAQPAAPPRSVP